MSTKQLNGYTPYFRELTEVQKNWGWFLALGILLIALGAIAIGSSIFVTVLSIFFLGVLLVIAGISQIIYSFWARQWSGLFLSQLIGILYIVTGFLCIAKPAVTALSLTLLIAAFFLVGGLFRMINSIALRYDHWGWVFINGLITFALGLLIFSDWPYSGLFIIGLFIGIDLILSGWTAVLLALTARPATR